MSLIPEDFSLSINDHVFEVNSLPLEPVVFTLYTLVSNRNEYKGAIEQFIMQDTAWGYTELNMLLIDLNQDQNLYEALSLRVYINRVEKENSTELTVWQDEESDLKRQKEDLDQQQRILQFRQFVHQLSSAE